MNVSSNLFKYLYNWAGKEYTSISSYNECSFDKFVLGSDGVPISYYTTTTTVVDIEDEIRNLVISYTGHVGDYNY